MTLNLHQSLHNQFIVPKMADAVILESTLIEIDDDWEQTPAAIQSIVFSNDVKLQVEFFYDSKKLSLDKYNPVEHLDDLCFTFTKNPSRYSKVTTFQLSFGEQTICWSDGNSATARIRIGPRLAQLVGVPAGIPLAFAVGSNLLTQTPDHTMQIFVRDSATSMPDSLSYDFYAFTKVCGSRSIRTMAPNRRRDPVPAEVAALYSDYFLTLFYRSFKESKRKCVEIADANAALIIHAIVSSATRLQPPMDAARAKPIAVNWDAFVEYLLHLDRFSFLRALYKLQEDYKTTFKTLVINENIARGIQEMSTIVRNSDLMRLFVDSFCMVECLDEWEKQNTNDILDDFRTIIAQRRANFEQIYESRPELRFQFQYGLVVFRLFHDFQPMLIKSFTEYRENIEYSKNSYGFPQLTLETQLIHEDTYPIGIFRHQVKLLPKQTGNQCRLYLIHSINPHSNASVLYIQSFLPDNAILMGVVTQGVGELVKGTLGSLIGMHRPKKCTQGL